MIEFFPVRNGHWHTLSGVFEARQPLRSLYLAGPTHLRVSGQYEPARDPDWMEVRSVRLFAQPTAGPRL